MQLNQPVFHFDRRDKNDGDYLWGYCPHCDKRHLGQMRDGIPYMSCGWTPVRKATNLDQWYSSDMPIEVLSVLRVEAAEWLAERGDRPLSFDDDELTEVVIEENAKERPPRNNKPHYQTVTCQHCGKVTQQLIMGSSAKIRYCPGNDKHSCRKQVARIKNAFYLAKEKARMITSNLHG
jgi:hypothetical protein